MKKLTFLTMMAIAAMLFASCNKIEYKDFVGTWGVEKIEYYNIDHWGNPIESSMETHIFDPNDTNNGIHLIFNDDQTGEMRDSAIDSIGVNWNEETESYESYIYCPDTILVNKFTASYDEKQQTLYLNKDLGEEGIYTYRLHIGDLDKKSFIYENEYEENYIEKAYLTRVSKNANKSTRRQAVTHPHKPGSLLGGR